ncbi:rod shape-determining protein MreC [Nocardioides terrae]|uniref:Cell shape-determining protein MreC n=1 Tax=Nocardioides terrae TaxID=574651 RepID=A0A1I1IPW3_9ACTN|nr:rod shape-determining protein MreC [Nocardioides terrae]SFC38265.1 rod shape-determining protein MreC [Nocardioides terrae]
MVLLNPERINRRGGLERPDPGTPKRPTVVALLLACAVLLVLDLTGPALTPARRLVGEVLGPLESGASTLARPVTSIPDRFHSQSALRRQVGRLEDDNAALRQQVATAGFDRNRLAEYDGLTAAAQNIGYAVVPARVVGYGASQSFSRTVTIDAGTSSGIAPDMTVVNSAGLVGRVLRVTRTTATVLLIADADSVVGGRVGSSMEVGFVHGTGNLGTGDLDLELLDQTEIPAEGDTVVTWGSSKGAPYVAGVPVGVVDSVYANVRDSTQHARITPMVDFTSLDVVGVAVPSGTKSDRAIIDADGRLK